MAADGRWPSAGPYVRHVDPMCRPCHLAPARSYLSHRVARGQNPSLIPTETRATSYHSVKLIYYPYPCRVGPGAQSNDSSEHASDSLPTASQFVGKETRASPSPPSHRCRAIVGGDNTISIPISDAGVDRRPAHPPNDPRPSTHQGPAWHGRQPEPHGWVPQGRAGQLRLPTVIRQRPTPVSAGPRT